MGGVSLGKYTNATDDEINAFLDEFKNAHEVIFLGQRLKNQKMLEILKINTKMAIKLTEKLSPDDYFKGPKPDMNSAHKQNGEVVWEFKKNIHGIFVYIKLQVRKNPIGQAFVISFHEDEYLEAN